MFRALVYLPLLMSPACAQAGQVTPHNNDALRTESLFEGVWMNERGSAVTFTQAKADEAITGYYQTALGQPDKSKRFPLTGFTQGDQITFTVNFKGYGSLTSWTGQMSEDMKGPYIQTLWHLTRDVTDDEEPEDMWGSITSGAATFRPLDTHTKPAP